MQNQDDTTQSAKATTASSFQPSDGQPTVQAAPSTPKFGQFAAKINASPAFQKVSGKSQPNFFGQSAAQSGPPPSQGVFGQSQTTIFGKSPAQRTATPTEVVPFGQSPAQPAKITTPSGLPVEFEKPDRLTIDHFENENAFKQFMRQNPSGMVDPKDLYSPEGSIGKLRRTWKFYSREDLPVRNATLLWHGEHFRVECFDEVKGKVVLESVDPRDKKMYHVDPNELEKLH
jgi:hypothetical protein